MAAADDARFARRLSVSPCQKGSSVALSSNGWLPLPPCRATAISYVDPDATLAEASAAVPQYIRDANLNVRSFGPGDVSRTLNTPALVGETAKRWQGSGGSGGSSIPHGGSAAVRTCATTWPTAMGVALSAAPGDAGGGTALTRVGAVSSRPLLSLQEAKTTTTATIAALPTNCRNMLPSLSEEPDDDPGRINVDTQYSGRCRQRPASRR